MNLPAALFSVRCLTRDTFRQSLASRAFWLLLAASAVVIVFCASVGVEGATAHTPPGEIELYGRDKQPYTGLNPARGQFTVAFGAIRLDMARDKEQAIRFLEALLALGAGALGMLLTIIWTAGLLPEFLQTGTAPVLLAKPVPRWSLLAGKYLGVLALVGFQLAVFIGGTWLALGLRTGVWPAGYLLAAPLLLLLFALVFAFSVLIGVWTRSTLACVVGSLALWAVCSAVNSGRHAQAAAGPAGAEAEVSPAWEAAYWVLPEPADVVLLLTRALETDRHFQASPTMRAATERKTFDPELSLLTSLLSAGGLLGLAAWRLGRFDC